MIHRFGPYVAAVLACVLASSPALGYLRIHPLDPHYFEETATGEPVMIASFTNIVPASADYDDEAAFRADTQSWRMPYVRVWHFTPWSLQNAIWPWAASSTGGGYWGGNGGNKLNMNVWNADYWARMHASIGRTAGAGVYAEIMLFDRVGLSPAANTRWGNNPWAANHNINNLETPNAQPPNDGTPEFYLYASRPNLRNQQERYVRKMIDETVVYDNVIYEIENEHWDHNDPAWADYYGRFVKNHIAANYPNSPRLVSYNSLVNDLDAFFTLNSVDIVNKHYGGEPENNPGTINAYIESRWHFNKPINIDEFANGLADPAILRRLCWETITSGGHFHIEDASPQAKPWQTVDNIRSFQALANWNFIGAAPNRGLITSGGGYCLAKPGEEYVCYFPAGGSKTVNLLQGSYRVEWWNPRTGAFHNVTTISHNGGGRSFSTPDGNDWVLHVTTRPPARTILEARPAGTITIDGNPADWNLNEFTTPIAGGDTGAGDVAIVGFGGYENWTCYRGGHWTDGQFPPAGAADHAVRVYTRYDTTYLYLLLRMADSDRRTPNGVSSNWANDCVEIYVDPGNDGGASPIANSTSEVQLVIDAANQKNVYQAAAGYAAQVLAGVSSAVTTDAAGWWLEVRLSRSAFNPALGSQAGIDFVFRDNDANSNALTTLYSWRDPEVSPAFPSKIPDRWGTLNIAFVPSVASDFDHDEDVDLDDYAHLQRCLAGPGTLRPVGCEDADLDADLDIDQQDVAIFIPCLGGANQPPGC